ncbi:MAG TPA: hypothetical protein PKW69_09000, partial [Niabella sp.]|nr:hypothetical protein [Niabella sp.]
MHQLAQKSTNTYLPFKELSANGLPFTSGSVKSGACLPTHMPPPPCAAAGYGLRHCCHGSVSECEYGGGAHA